MESVDSNDVIVLRPSATDAGVSVSQHLAFRLNDASYLDETHRTSQKRRLDEAQDAGKKGMQDAKRLKLKGAVHTSYLHLYNDVISGITEDAPHDFLSNSVLGSVRWSSAEKSAFFKALSLRGRDDTRAIAQSIGSKSEPEVEEFLRVLQQGSDELSTYEPAQCVSRGDIPAAFEVGKGLEEELEAVADQLVIRVDLHEQRALEHRHGNMWLLDHKVLRAIESNNLHLEDHVSQSDPCFQDASEALEIFELKNFLSLSANLYMNSSDETRNFRTYARNGELPGIRLQAFVDFYRLVRMVTERLLSAVIHCTRSRRRAALSSAMRTVWPRDVGAAVRILGIANPQLRVTLHDYWVPLARRYKVEYSSSRGADAQLVSYEEGEAYLRAHLRPAFRTGWEWLSKKQAPEMQQNMGQENYLSSFNQTHETSSGHTDSDDQSNEAVETKESYPLEIEDDVEDWYLKESENEADDVVEDDLLEKFDQQVAEKEARHLRKIFLSTDEAVASSSDEDVLPPNWRPVDHGKTLDWRRKLVYQSEWEQFSESMYKENLEAEVDSEEPSKVLTENAMSEGSEGSEEDASPPTAAENAFVRETSFEAVSETTSSTSDFSDESSSI